MTQKHNMQMLGVHAGSHRYDANEVAEIVSRLFAWLPPGNELALKNTCGRDLFQQSRVDGYCQNFLRYCFFGSRPPEFEIWWWMVIRVRLHFALDYFRSQTLLRPEWELIATPEVLVDFLYSQLTLSWQVEGLKWLLLSRARLPLLTP